MELFLDIFFSFPVIVFSILLTVCILFWLITATGCIDIDVLNIDVDASPDIPTGAEGGLLFKLHFNEVPMTIIITFISLFGWLISYFTYRYLLIWLIDVSLFYYAAGIASLIVIFIIAIYLTSLAIYPLRGLFKRAEGLDSYKRLLGQVAIVRTSVVNSDKGEAIFDDNGAGLILQVRSYEENDFTRDSRVVLLQYNPAQNSYEVISEDEFSKN